MKKIFIYNIFKIPACQYSIFISIAYFAPNSLLFNGFSVHVKQCLIKLIKNEFDLFSSLCIFIYPKKQRAKSAKNAGLALIQYLNLCLEKPGSFTVTKSSSDFSNPYSTVTLFARFLGWSTSVPLSTAM